MHGLCAKVKVRKRGLSRSTTKTANPSRVPSHDQHPSVLRTGIQRNLRHITIRRGNKYNVDGQRYIQAGSRKRFASAFFDLSKLSV
jgi:hypothetical protein